MGCRLLLLTGSTVFVFPVNPPVFCRLPGKIDAPIQIEPAKVSAIANTYIRNLVGVADVIA